MKKTNNEVRNIKDISISLGYEMSIVIISEHYSDVRHNEHDGVWIHHPDSLIKENIKAPRHWPLWGEFTGDRLIPRTKDQ